jgi:hypothetical protein
MVMVIVVVVVKVVVAVMAGVAERLTQNMLLG